MIIEKWEKTYWKHLLKWFNREIIIQWKMSAFCCAARTNCRANKTFGRRWTKPMRLSQLVVMKTQLKISSVKSSFSLSSPKLPERLPRTRREGSQWRFNRPNLRNKPRISHKSNSKKWSLANLAIGKILLADVLSI